MSEKPINAREICTFHYRRSPAKPSGKGRFQCIFCWIEPTDDVHPYATELLKTMNHSTDFAKTKSVKDISEEKMDFVFSVCDTVNPQDVPDLKIDGDPFYADWVVPDPK